MKEITRRDFLKVTGSAARLLPAFALPGFFETSQKSEELPLKVDWLPVYDGYVDECFRRAGNPFQRWECLFGTKNRLLYYGLSVSVTVANSVYQPDNLLLVCNQPYSELYKMSLTGATGSYMVDSSGKFTATTLNPLLASDAALTFNRAYSVDLFLYQLAEIPRQVFGEGEVPRYVKNCDLPKEADRLITTAPFALGGLNNFRLQEISSKSGYIELPIKFPNAIRVTERNGSYGYYIGKTRRLVDRT